MNRYRQKTPSKPVVRSGSTLVEPTGEPAERLAAAEREADVWKGKLTREIAIGRIMARLGMNQRAAQAEVDGFLRD